MFRRALISAVVLLALLSSAPAAQTNRAVGTHKLIVAVEKNLAPAAEKRLVVLVLISRDGGSAPAGALVTPSKPLTVLQDNSGLYRVRAVINSPCKGSCDGSYRISGSANHKLRIIPSCQLMRSSFVCSRVRIVKVY